VLGYSVRKRPLPTGKYVLTPLLRNNFPLVLLLTVNTSVKLRSDVTDSPVFTHFKEIVEPSAPVMNTFTFPLCIIYTFSSESPRKKNIHGDPVT